MNDIQKAIQGARAAQVGRIYGGFSNAQEVTADEDSIRKSNEEDFEKARSGVYADTAENRRLGRVGQTFGGKKQGQQAQVKNSEDSNVNKEVVDRMLRSGFLANKKGDTFSDRDGNRRLKINEDGSVTWSQYDEDGKRFNKKFSNVDEALKNRWIKKESKSDKDVEKSEDDELNPFEKAASEEYEEEPSEVEKSDIMNALDYGSSIKVQKTGKEIKKQITDVVLPELNAELAVKKNEANEKLKDCGSAPTKEPETYWTAGIKMDCGHKVYDWEETYVPRKEGVSVDTLSAEDAIDKHVNVPENQEQSNARRAYNDCVRAICDVMVDIKACEILGSLKDATEYELTPRQMTTFKF